MEYSDSRGNSADICRFHQIDQIKIWDFTRINRNVEMTVTKLIHLFKPWTFFNANTPILVRFLLRLPLFHSGVFTF